MGERHRWRHDIDSITFWRTQVEAEVLTPSRAHGLLMRELPSCGHAYTSSLFRPCSSGAPVLLKYFTTKKEGKNSNEVLLDCQNLETEIKSFLIDGTHRTFDKANSFVLWVTRVEPGWVMAKSEPSPPSYTSCKDRLARSLMTWWVAAESMSQFESPLGMVVALEIGWAE